MKLHTLKQGQRAGKGVAVSHPQSSAEKRRQWKAILKKQTKQYSRAKQKRAAFKSNRATIECQNRKQPKRGRKDAETSRLRREVKRQRKTIPAPGSTESKKGAMKKPAAPPKNARGKCKKAKKKSRKITKRMLPKRSVEDPRLRHVRECQGLVVILPVS